MKFWHATTKRRWRCGGIYSCVLAMLACLPRPKEASPEPPKSVITPHDVRLQVSLESVQMRLLQQHIVSSARLVFDEDRLAHVFPPVTGRVSRILAHVGDSVRRGQILAHITSPDLGSAYADVQKARPSVVQTEKELARQKTLFAAQAGPLRDLESAQSNHAQAVAEMQRATEKLQLLEKAGQAQKDTQEFYLKAPLEGEIIARQINIGMEVQGQYSGGATQELYTIGRQDALWLLADVYEQDAARVHVGAAVKVQTPAYPGKEFSGQVEWISASLDPLLRTLSVRCTLPNQPALLKAQMYAKARIASDGQNSLAIPRSALLHFADKTFVVAVNRQGDAFVKVPVTVDEVIEGDWLPVLRGLQAGDKIVTRGALLVASSLDAASEPTAGTR